ncbi:very short patch repair endonuclease [Streptomyces atroolivaceus]|uniref:very short patch repair endonuclease n=1 Tax=Streptomyces atroolivaceus TaxID=66869 RepID=UPI00378BB4C2
MSCEARATVKDGDELRGAGVGARMRDGVCRQGVPAPRDANVRRVMLAQRSRNTAPEMALRRALHALGFRYRVDLPLPGMRRRRSDLTFVRWRTVVFVQGCFWHACPQHMQAPVHNAEWWREKFEGNVRRDTDTDTRLVRMGWGPYGSGNTRSSTQRWARWCVPSANRGIRGRCGSWALQRRRACRPL